MSCFIRRRLLSDYSQVKSRNLFLLMWDFADAFEKLSLSFDFLVYALLKKLGSKTNVNPVEEFKLTFL